MYYVALMTFILIFSSVTMVLAVDAGHHLQKTKVAIYMLLTIIGGFIFVGSQAWEWKNFIGGEFGAIETKGGSLLQFVDATTGKRVAVEDFAAHLPTTRIDKKRSNGIWFEDAPALPAFTVAEVEEGLKSHANVVIRTENIDPATKKKVVLNREQSLEAIKGGALFVKGANLEHNEYGHKLFADFFFFITGFHGFHVFSGVVINILIFLNVVYGTYEKRRSYEMVEKVGLYWHFVDLVWVFVFTFFYLV
jgi:cytochrome c oxidase subunit 3